VAFAAVPGILALAESRWPSSYDLGTQTASAHSPQSCASSTLHVSNVPGPDNGRLLSAWLPLLRLPRRAKAKTLYGHDHLLDGDLSGVVGHHRLLRLETYICAIHALQPFQGLLDRDGSGSSRHPLNSQNDGRGRSQPYIRGDQ